MSKKVSIIELHVTEESLMENLRDASQELDCELGINGYDFLSDDEKAEVDGMVIALMEYTRKALIRKIEFNLT